MLALNSQESPADADVLQVPAHPAATQAATARVSALDHEARVTPQPGHSPKETAVVHADTHAPAMQL